MKFVCTANYFMEDGECSFRAGKVYDFAEKSYNYLVAKDDLDEYHYMDVYRDMWFHFIPVVEDDE